MRPKMKTLSCRQIEFGSPEYEATVALRDAVLRRPLGLEFSPAQLAAESADYHLACFRDDELAGCLILVPGTAGRIQMRQVAVAGHAQGQGVGRALIVFAEEFARGHGFHEMTLHARETAVPFYHKLGYQRVGERFEEVTLPHWEMRKPL